MPRRPAPPGSPPARRPGEVKALGRFAGEPRPEPVELRFRNVLVPPSQDIAGLSLFACEHLTPAPMRRPAWLVHPNGAKAIRSCTVVAADTAPLADAMARLFGSAAITRTDNVFAAHTGHGVILIAPPEDAKLIHPLLELPATVRAPMLAALTLEVADPERTAGFLRLQGVPFARSPSGDVLVAPAKSSGVALELVRGCALARWRRADLAREPLPGLARS